MNYFNKTLNANPYHDPLSGFIFIYKDMIWGDIVEHWQRSNFGSVFF